MKSSIYLVVGSAALIWGGVAMAATFTYLDPDKRTPLVFGEDSIAHDGSSAVRTTIYRDATHALMARETCRYDSATLALESVSFEDFGGEAYDVAVKDGKAQVAYRDTASGEPKSSEIEWDARNYLPRLLGDLIANRWADLRKDGEVSFDLYIPFLMRTMGFRLKSIGGRATGTRLIKTQPSLLLLRPFVPSIEFTVTDDETPRILTYRGPAAVTIAGEKHKQIVMNFGD